MSANTLILAGLKVLDVGTFIFGPAPAIGQHTDEVLRSLGYDSGEIERLRQSKAIA